MKSAVLTLLPQTVFGTQSENYDGVATTFSGVPVKASSYYSKDRSLQTLHWSLNGFEGQIVVEATLDADSETAHYFPLLTIYDPNDDPITENDFQNLTGNFTWIRATVVDFAAGEIRKVTLGY